jgi:membrane protein
MTRNVAAKQDGARSERTSPLGTGILVLCLLLASFGHARRDASARAPSPEPTEPPSDDGLDAPLAAIHQPGRGREAERPEQITLAGWRDIAMRLWRRLGSDNLSLVAAGVAFYAMLAIFPALAAFISLYGLIADTHSVERMAAELAAVMPVEAAKLLTDALRTLIGKANSQLNLALAISILVALWSARTGMASLVTGLNIAYEEEEKRGFVEQQLVAIGLTIGAIVFAAIAGAALAGVPAAIAFLPLSERTETVLAVARWPVLAVFVMVAVAILYRIAPSRRDPKWRWVSWGAVLATLSWLGGSALFSLYVSRFSSYDATYGSLGAVVVLLLWFWLSALVVLFGAVINAEAEHQTARDSTVGAEKPLGQRGARMADTIGISAG